MGAPSHENGNARLGVFLSCLQGSLSDQLGFYNRVVVVLIVEHVDGDSGFTEGGLEAIGVAIGYRAAPAVHHRGEGLGKHSIDPVNNIGL